MKKIAILSNHHLYTYNFRKEIIQSLINEGLEVYIILPYGEKVELLKEMGCKFIDVTLNRRGRNPFEEISLLKSYYRILKKIKPDAVLSYTIKPNLYGGIVCRRLNIPFYPNITGLGSSSESSNGLQNMIMEFYKIAFKSVECVFFQNKNNKQVFLDKNIDVKNSRVIPGSGVNTAQFSLLSYPVENNTLNFIFISRIMKEKGIEEYLNAAKYIRKKYPNTRFHICGFCEEEYEDTLGYYEKKGIINYHGMLNNIREILKITHCTIHPSYHEGLSNVLLESAASGRPVLASDIPGCRETFDEGISGYGFEPRSTESLIQAIEKFIKLSYEEKKAMGEAGRRKVEKEFDRQIVVDAYMQEIEKILEG